MSELIWQCNVNRQPREALEMKKVRFIPKFIINPILLLISCFSLATAQPALVKGKQHFTFSQWHGPSLKVWIYQPSNFSPDSPVIFVMHGVGRDADRYRDEWAKYAELNQFLLVVPEFRSRDFPKAAGYNLGNIFKNNSGTLNAKSQWAFSAIEPLFDNVRKRFDLNTNMYSMYGHSAGAQFVHRYLYFVPGTRLNYSVAANSGWYTLASFEHSFPYGLAGSPLQKSELPSALSKNLTVLLGTHDDDPEDDHLRRAPEAMAQGPHRLSRGKYFYTQAQSFASKEGMTFNWQLRYAPGVDHDNAKMIKFAIPLLISEK